MDDAIRKAEQVLLAAHRGALKARRDMGLAMQAQAIAEKNLTAAVEAYERELEAARSRG